MDDRQPLRPSGQQVPSQKKPAAPQAARRPAPKKRQERGVWFYRIALFVIVFVLLFALCVGLGLLAFRQTDKEDKKSYKLDLFGTKSTISAAEIYRTPAAKKAQTPYISISAIARAEGWTVTGSSASYRFVIDCGDTYQYATFTPGSPSVCVNGRYILLPGTVETDGNEVFIPSEFLTLYMSGVESTMDAEARTMTVAKIGDIRFTIARPDAAEHISVLTIPVLEPPQDDTITDQENEGTNHD